MQSQHDNCPSPIQNKPAHSSTLPGRGRTLSPLTGSSKECSQCFGLRPSEQEAAFLSDRARQKDLVQQLPCSLWLSSPFFNSSFSFWWHEGKAPPGPLSPCCSLLLPRATARTWDSPPKPFAHRNQLSSVLWKHKLQRTWLTISYFFVHHDKIKPAIPSFIVILLNSCSQYLSRFYITREQMQPKEHLP